jgi:hypothetical protein
LRAPGIIASGQSAIEMDVSTIDEQVLAGGVTGFFR